MEHKTDIRNIVHVPIVIFPHYVYAQKLNYLALTAVFIYSSGHKKVYVIFYAVAIVRYNRKRNVHTVHGNICAVQRLCLI